MEWVSVKDRLPTKEECEKYFGWFLVWRDELQKRPDMSRFDKYDDLTNGYEHGWKYTYDHMITHWMELPEPPSEHETNL